MYSKSLNNVHIFVHIIVHIPKPLKGGARVKKELLKELL